MGLYLCIGNFVACLLLTRQRMVYGLCAVVTSGYGYGILRANYLDTYSHFIFDAAVLGFYLALLTRPPDTSVLARGKPTERWLCMLIGWAIFMFMLPLQHPLIQLVGLRGNAFLVPFLLIGAWLSHRDTMVLAMWLAVLNLIAFGFALAEY